jgi:hypothetical protein
MRAMRSRLHQIVVPVIVLAAVASAAGCGGSSNSSTTSTTSSTTTTTSAAATTAATTTTTATSGTTTSASAAASSALGALASAGNCKSLAGLGQAYSQALSGSGTVDIAKEATLLQQFAQKVPASIKPDFEIFANDLQKVASAIGSYKPGSTPSPAALAKLASLATSINTTQLQAASKQIESWAVANCKPS